METNAQGSNSTMKLVTDAPYQAEIASLRLGMTSPSSFPRFDLSSTKGHNSVSRFLLSPAYSIADTLAYSYSCFSLHQEFLQLVIMLTPTLSIVSLSLLLHSALANAQVTAAAQLAPRQTGSDSAFVGYISENGGCR